MKAMLYRDAILYKRGALPALILTLLMAAVCALSAFAVLRGAREGRAPVRVAVVDREGGLLSRYCINLVSGQSYIASLMDIERLNAEKAREALRQGEVCAIVILPEGYVGDILSGTPSTGQIILSEAAAASADTVASVAVFGERLLTAGQYGVFAGENLILEKGLSEELRSAFLEESNSRLMVLALGIFDEGLTLELTPYAGSGLTTEAYYASAWLTLFLIVCGLFFTALFTADIRRPMLLRLRSLGVRPWAFALGKLLYPLSFRLVTAAALVALLSLILPVSLTAFSVLSAFAALVLMSLLYGGAALLLSGRSGWQGLLLFFALVGLFFNGGLVPKSMLPEALTAMGRFTPSGALMSLLSPLFGGQAGRSALPWVAGAALILWGLALLRIKRAEGGEA